MEKVPNVTLEQFEERYARESGVTVEWLHENGSEGRPCDCDYEDCEGWQMVHIRLIKEALAKGVRIMPAERALLEWKP